MDLESKDGVDQLNFYRGLLLHLGEHGSAWVKAILRERVGRLLVAAALNLKKLVDAIDELDWYSAKDEGFGDLYEGLLEKNAGEKKSGAGQYFTPRPLIDSMVHLVKPQPGELVAGPGGGDVRVLDRGGSVREGGHGQPVQASPERQQQFQKRHGVLRR